MAKTKSFEEMIDELEEIVTRLESGDAPLDEAVRLFEKGMKISVSCHDKLEKAEQKVKILTESQTGEVVETDMESGEEG